MAITTVGVLALGLAMFAGDEFDNAWGLPLSVIGGLLVGYAIGKVAEIWTSDQYGPVKKIAAASEPGPATTNQGGIPAGIIPRTEDPRGGTECVGTGKYRWSP